MCVFPELAPIAVQSISHNVHLIVCVSVCVFVPLVGAQNPMDWTSGLRAYP